MKDEYYLIYTTEQAGNYKAIGPSTLESCEEHLKDGFIEFKTSYNLAEKVYLAYAMITKKIKDYDFIIGEER